MGNLAVILDTDIGKAVPKEIVFNFEELQTELGKRLDKYQNLVVTKEAISSAKKERAELNKVKTSFEGFRKDIKSACLQPYEDFEGKMKVLVGMIDRSIQNIDSQVKVFEEEERAEKYAAIQRFYRDNIQNLGEILPLEKILNPKWENKGLSLINITQEISEKIQEVKENLNHLESLASPYEEAMISSYLKRLNLSDALAEGNRLEEQSKARELLKAAEENRKRQTPPSQSIVEVSQRTPEPIQDNPKQEELISFPIEFLVPKDCLESFKCEMREICDRLHIQRKGIKSWQQK